MGTVYPNGLLEMETFQGVNGYVMRHLRVRATETTY